MSAIGIAFCALARDHENGAQAIGAGAEQECAQAALGIGLREAMQIQTRVDLDMTSGNTACRAPLDGDERWRRFRQGSALPLRRRWRTCSVRARARLGR